MLKWRRMGAERGGVDSEERCKAGWTHARHLGERQVCELFFGHHPSSSDQETSVSAASASLVLACSTSFQRYSFRFSIPWPLALETGMTPVASGALTAGKGCPGESRSALVSRTTWFFWASSGLYASISSRSLW